ncbi:phage tail protein [Bacillus sp. PK3_68]|uniref:tail fiber protein n=1 Tax=Bacillus sp. PK3_68 TaxID=2027408 RepID=UPI001C7DD324|nr:phage tail protein [Bacillus sp. PK3_68]
MAEHTPRLNLYMKDPIVDKEDTFNIETMLNQNFRKIDEKVATLGPNGKLAEDQCPPIPEVKEASTTQKGIVQLSNSTTSDSEEFAATSKAVKTAETNAKAYTDTAPEAMLQHMERFVTKRSSKNANGIFLTVEKKRKDGTLFMRAEFSEPNADGNPTVRTVTTYAADGITVVGAPVIYDVIYDADGDYVEEVPR